MRKNITDQVIGAQLIDASDGSAFSGATVTVYITGDGGTQTAGAVGSGACTDEGNGFFSYVTNAAETNKDHLAFTFTATGAIPVTLQVYTRLDTLTAELQSDWEDGGRLDLILDGVLQDTGTTIPATIATIDTEVGAIDTVVDLILEDTGTTIPATIVEVKTETALIVGDTAELQSDWANDGRLDVILDGVLQDTGTTLQGELDAIQAAVITNAAGADIAADVIALKAETALIVGDTAELQGDWVNDGRLDAILDTAAAGGGGGGATASAVADAVWDRAVASHTDVGSLGKAIADIEVDTDSLNGTKIPDTISLTALNAEVDGCLELYDAPKHSELTTAIATLATPAQVLTQSALALTDIHLDHLLAANYDPTVDGKPGDPNALLNELIESDGGVSRFTSNALEQGPSGAGILAPLVLLDTTVVSIDGGQTSVVLTAGSGDDDVYNNRTIVFTDQSTATQKSVRRILNWDQASKTVTLDSAPDFTVAASDACVILSLPGISGSDVAAELETYDGPKKSEMDSAISGVGVGPLILADTVVTGLVSQTVFRLTAGSDNDSAYVGMLAIVTDVGSPTRKAVGIVSAYTGTTKQITLRSDPGVFAMADLDLIQIVAVSTPEAGSGALTPAELNQLRYWVGIDGTQTAPSSNTPSLASLANQTTTHNRLGAWTGTGVNTLLGALKAMLSKSASLPSDIEGTFDPTTDSVEALRDRGDAEWTTGPAAASPFSEDDAKGIRYILNLDGTQVAPVISPAARLVVNATQIEGADATDQINSACDTAIDDYAAAKPSHVTAAQTSIEADIAALTATIPSAAAVSTAVWGESTRALTDKVGFALTSGERAAISTLLQADLEDLSAAEVLTQTTAALATYDGPKHSELTSDTASIIAAISGLDTVSASDVLTQATAALNTYDGPKHSELLSDTASIVAAISGLEDLDAAAIAAQVVSGLTTYDAVNQTDLNTSQAAIIAALPASGGTVSLSVTSPPQDGDTVVLKRGNPATLVFTVVDVITMSDVLLGISDEAGRSLLKLSGVIDTTTQCTFSISISDALILREGSFNLDVFEVAGYDATTGAYTDAKSIVTGPVTIEPLYLRLEND